MQNIKYKFYILVIIVIFLYLSCSNQPQFPTIFYAQGEMSGEVTQTSAILQSRFTSSDSLIDGNVPGCHGFGRFELSTTVDSKNSNTKTDCIEAVPANDYIVKTKITGLTPGTRYYYRLIYGTEKNITFTGEIRTFKTLADTDKAEEVSFVVVTGMNHAFFHYGRPNDPSRAYQGNDKHLGYPALEAMLGMNPYFFICTGDNVYYDHPVETRAKTVAELRKKWHEQFVQERFKRLFARVPTYWEKDDHDYRYNDSDPSDNPDPSKPDNPEVPSHELGIATFIEQVPVVDPSETSPVTYRTHRINKLLQIWFVEGRDYRSPNSMPNGPQKTIFGDKQKTWLKQTLLESDATFKLLISPTPMVGPDDAYKIDNHVNYDGFRYEGDEFFEWLKNHGFLTKNFYLICGDRHWQYHAVHPSGFEEFSCGALVDANSRL
ncbi:MAG: alkaline phosphatase D family protein, partial [Candidatus Latescibacteria bacterium]|nr:alkaline phosphatase D family protein [Candidatus Latescibacterota bacterium]